ncbi:MAG: hypothetical protein WKF86_05215 [Acidimicrobiales bacterium]
MNRRLDLRAFREVEGETASAGPDQAGDAGRPPPVAVAAPADRPTPTRARAKKARAAVPAAPAAPAVATAAEKAGKVGPLLPPELATQLRCLGAEGYVISSILTHGLTEFGEEWLADRRQQTGPRRRSDVGRVQVTLYLQGAARSRLQELAEAAGTSQSEAATGVLRLAVAALEHGEDRQDA